jgi:hypothetical protein
MNTKQFIAAAAVFVAAGSAFAADVPATTTAINAAVIAADAASNKLNVPVVSITANGGRARAEVKAEAVEFVKNHKTAFAIQLEQYK